VLHQSLHQSHIPCASPAASTICDTPVLQGGFPETRERAPSPALQSVMHQLRITQRGLARAASISKSAAGRLVLNDEWPLRNAETVRNRVLQHLRACGAHPDDLAAIEAAAKEKAPASSQLARAGNGAASDATTPANPLTDQQEDPMLLRNEQVSTEARQHFGLPRSPFIDDITCRADVFQCPSTRVARAALMDAALNHGFVALMGESGSGKTTLREELEQRILDDARPVIVIKPYVLEMEPDDAKGRRMKSGQIAEAIITTLAPTLIMKSSPQARARQAHELLAASFAAGNRHLLVIEEAHRMPKATLKHLKGFLELKRGLQRLMGIALIAQPELARLLNEQDPEIREIVQRCEQIHLAPLDNDLEAYLRHKFARLDVGLQDVLADDAIDAIRARLVKIPRGGTARDAISICHPLVVNNLVARAMNAAAAYQLTRVDAQVIAGC
jgi:type II secretory pathway predicted ATPase ExeA